VTRLTFAAGFGSPEKSPVSDFRPNQDAAILMLNVGPVCQQIRGWRIRPDGMKL
jgi:hypothetical protein